jgi:hypothetical protein
MVHITCIRSVKRTINMEVVSYRTSFRNLPDKCGWILIKMGIVLTVSSPLCYVNNTMYIIMCIFTSTCSQNHNNCCVFDCM